MGDLIVTKILVLRWRSLDMVAFICELFRCIIELARLKCKVVYYQDDLTSESRWEKFAGHTVQLIWDKRARNPKSLNGIKGYLQLFSSFLSKIPTCWTARYSDFCYGQQIRPRLADWSEQDVIVIAFQIKSQVQRHLVSVRWLGPTVLNVC